MNLANGLTKISSLSLQLSSQTAFPLATVVAAASEEALEVALVVVVAVATTAAVGVLVYQVG